MRKYIIGTIILFFCALVLSNYILKNKNEALRLENNRINLNYATLANDRDSIQTYNLKLKELTDEQTFIINSQSEALKIKPKQITKYITITQTIRDTIDREVLVSVLNKNEWLISDTTKCFTWEGKATLSNDLLNVKRTNFTYHNKTMETFYKKRPFSFLFIKYGRWQYYQVVDSECGSSAIKTINIVK